MSYRRYVIFLVILFSVIFSLSFLFTSLTPSKNILLALTKPIKTGQTETDVTLAIKRLIDGQDEIFVKTTDSNICYWIKPTMDETNYLLEISEYENTEDMKGCIGILKSTEYIVLDHPINLRGIDCICGGNRYLLELKANGLKITR